MTTSQSAPQTHAREEIEARAADFLHRRRISRWNEADQVELNAWLDESTLHRVAYLRLVAGEALIEKAVELRPSRSRRLDFKRNLRFAFPFLASVAALALIGMFAMPYIRHLLTPPDRIYSTDVGGRALLSFADKTQIELNTDTVVRYRMTSDERAVWLEHGEAWFHVAHNAANPFTVIVGKHRVTDLGTEFLVRRGSDRMEVALLNGRATLSTEGAQTATLRPGDDAVATPVSMSVTHKTPQQLSDELAWRRGVIVFRNTRLADAVREFNRYNATKLVIADPSIADLKVSAEVKIENYEDFLNIAETVLSLRADREGNDILISRRGRAVEAAKGRAKRGAAETVRP